ncbi:MAG: DciA family protein [Ghiorsea sp.]
MAKRKQSTLKPISFNLGKVLDPDRLMRITSIGILRRRWPDIVGNMMALHCEPIAIEPQQDGSLGLIIAVDHSVIAQHIRLLHEDIRKACFKQCKLQGLTKVWTRLQAGAGIREEKKERRFTKLTCSDLRLLAETIQDVEDKALRRLMFKAGAAQITNQIQDKG